jgi:hypothetical protein
MFGLFSKNNPGVATVKFANNMGYLYKNLLTLEKLPSEQAQKKFKCLAVYYVKEIVENPIMDNLDVSFKCMIPEMYAFKRVTIAHSTSEISILLYQIAEEYNLISEYSEIREKGNLFYEYENCYKH